MNEYNKAVLVEAGERIAAAGAGLVAAYRALNDGLEKAIKKVDELCVNIYATPNERRMMHHRKKRIRRKYYNRVKRRIKMPEPPKEEGENT